MRFSRQTGWDVLAVPVGAWVTSPDPGEAGEAGHPRRWDGCAKDPTHPIQDY